MNLTPLAQAAKDAYYATLQEDPNGHADAWEHAANAIEHRLRAEIADLKKRLDLCVADEPTGVYREGEAAGYKRAIAFLREHDAPIARACANLLEDVGRRPKCPECGGDLGGVEIGRIEDHRAGCSRLPR